MDRRLLSSNLTGHRRPAPQADIIWVGALPIRSEGDPDLEYKF
jgi:hypothetical protein